MIVVIASKEPVAKYMPTSKPSPIGDDFERITEGQRYFSFKGTRSKATIENMEQASTDQHQQLQLVLIFVLHHVPNSSLKLSIQTSVMTGAVCGQR